MVSTNLRAGHRGNETSGTEMLGGQEEAGVKPGRFRQEDDDETQRRDCRSKARRKRKRRRPKERIRGMMRPGRSRRLGRKQ